MMPNVPAIKFCLFRRALLGALVLAVGFLGIARAQAEPAPVAPVAPINLAAPLPPVTFEDWRFVRGDDQTQEFAMAFPSPLPSGDPTNDRVTLRVVLPTDRPGPHQVIVLLHYLGAGDDRFERRAAARLARRGFASVLVALPYHLERTPPGRRSGELAVVPDVPRIRLTLAQAILDVRRTMDWVQTRPEFQSKQVGLAGVSLGAIVAAGVAGTDPRAHPCAFLLGGIEVAHLLWNSSRVAAQRDTLRRQGWTEDRAAETLADVEPLSYLRPDPNRISLVVQARFDTVVPKLCTQSLITALGNADVVTLDTGHFGGVFAEGPVLNEVGDFFTAAFRGQRRTGPTKLPAPTLRLAIQGAVGRGLDVGIGFDLWRSNARRDVFVPLLLTPRGLRLSPSVNVGGGFSLGASIDRSGVAPCFTWSVVL